MALFILSDQKRCSKCRQVKPISEFYRRSDQPGKHKPECKICFGVRTRASRAKNPAGRKAYYAKNVEMFRRHARAKYVRNRSNLRGWVNTNLTTRRQQCRKAKILFTLTTDDVLAIYEHQDGKCALTGRELKWGIDSNRGPDTLSIDRIDAVGPYVRSNVRLVTHWANVARQRFTDDEFVEMCRTVVNLADKPIIALMIATPKGRA